MKAITRLHPRKTQHHIQSCLNLSSCCGSKWCTSTYTFTFNNNILDVLQRVRHLLHNWTLFSWFLANSPKNVDIACKAFPFIHCRSCPWRWWAFNLHWVNIHRELTLGVNKFFAISRVPRPFGAFLWYFTTRTEYIFPCCNRAFKHDFYGVNIWYTFFFILRLMPWDMPTCGQPVVRT